MPGARVLLLSLVLSLLPLVWGQTAADQAFDQAVRLQQAGKWREAEQAYRSHIKQFGATPQTLGNLGAVLVKAERFPEAIRTYTQALKLAPAVLPLRLNLGLAYFKSGQLAPAAEQFSTILQAEPGHRQARQLRAMCRLELERFAGAAEDYAALLPTEDVNVALTKRTKLPCMLCIPSNSNAAASDSGRAALPLNYTDDCLNVKLIPVVVRAFPGARGPIRVAC
jgi:tetratricopeptide (TPR) repeat protein